jgi:hypothetical protein
MNASETADKDTKEQERQEQMKRLMDGYRKQLAVNAEMLKQQEKPTKPPDQ